MILASIAEVKRRQAEACPTHARYLLRSRVAGLLTDAEQRRKTLRLDQELLDAYRFEGIVGRSPLMLEVFANVRRIAPHFSTVLVTGATGTGKELIAQALRVVA